MTDKNEVLKLHGNVQVASERLMDAANRYPSNKPSARHQVEAAALGYALAILRSEGRHEDEAAKTLTAYVALLGKTEPSYDPCEHLCIIDKMCAVTAFEMHAQVHRDGRERGLWLTLSDESDIRNQCYRTWLDGRIEEAFTFMKAHPDDNSKKFSLGLHMHTDVARLLAGSVREAALLEWPAMKQVYDAIGKELRAHEAKAKPIRGRTPRKPDRRADSRRRDDKRKARLPARAR